MSPHYDFIRSWENFQETKEGGGEVGHWECVFEGNYLGPLLPGFVSRLPGSELPAEQANCPPSAGLKAEKPTDHGLNPLTA